MNLNSNDDVISYGRTSGYGSQYNDILLAYLRAYFGVSTGTLPDLWARWTKEGHTFLESHTNTALRSQEIENATWSKVQLIAVVAGANIAPDGTATAEKVIPSTTAGVQHRLDQTTVSAAGINCFSVYGKPSNYTYIGLRINGVGVSFNLSTGEVGLADVETVSSGIEDAGNGWYRCYMSQNAAANAVIRININDNLSSIAPNYAGDGINGVLLWGAQYEVNRSTPTAYIPTAAAIVTRP